MITPTLQLNHTKYKQIKIAAISSSIALALGGLAFLQPFSLHDNSYAETASLDTSVTLEPTLSIWTTDTNNNASSQVNIAADPDESVATGSIRAHVSTNNLTGYTLTIQSNSTDAKMVHENESITKTINPITGSGTSASSWKSNSSLNNMWGYSIGNNDSFVEVPGSSSDATTIDETDAPNNDNYTDVTFAAKANLSLPAGTYTDTVVFSAVANAVPTTLKQAAAKAGITTMQGMEGSTVCSEADVWQEGEEDLTLTDTRDNSTYVIRKLADGNCWMVQNLRLINKKITSADSDVSSDFTIPASSLSTGTTNGTWGTSNDANGINHTAAYYNNNTTYGAYYNWYTATAGSGTYSTGSNVSVNSSICPKGWKLPYGTQVNKSWYYLYNTGYSSNVSNFQSATLTGSGYWAGYVNAGSLGNAGSYGYWWSRTANSASSGYRLLTSSGNVIPQNFDSKRLGFAVRCVLSSE